LGAKGKKGFPVDSIYFVKLEERFSEAIMTASEWFTAVFMIFS
jgi:hypothetical protein